MDLEDKRLTISILGCGWYGLPLAKSLIEKGYRVKGSTTSSEKLSLLQESEIESYQINFSLRDTIYNPEFFQSDVLIIAIPPNRKSGEANYYPQKIESICKKAIEGRVRHIVLISSTGVYDNTQQEFNESDLPQPSSESGKALRLAENIVLSQKDSTATILRFGGLFGPNRNPGRFLKNKKSIPNGLAPVNMIHLNDCLGITHSILEHKSFGKIYNACSPQHPSRIEFYTHAAVSTHEPAPDFVHELKEWKVVNSINIPLYLKYIFKEELIS